MAFVRQRPPDWFWLTGTALTLWGVIGCYLWFRWAALGAGPIGPASAYDRALFAELPGWYKYLHAIAVGAGVLGGLALLARSLAARVLFIVSLIAVVIRFGWLFASTDVLATKGPATALFPIGIALVAGYSVWLAAKAHRHGWIC